MSEFKNVLPERLVHLRKKKNFSQYELAERLGFSRGLIANYEQGRREPDCKTILIFASFYNVSVDYLLERSSDTTHKFCDEEVRLIFDYRSLDERGKEAIKNNVAYEVSRNAKANTTKKSAM